MMRLRLTKVLRGDWAWSDDRYPFCALPLGVVWNETVVLLVRPVLVEADWMTFVDFLPFLVFLMTDLEPTVKSYQHSAEKSIGQKGSQKLFGIMLLHIPIKLVISTYMTIRLAMFNHAKATRNTTARSAKPPSTDSIQNASAGSFSSSASSTYPTHHAPFLLCAHLCLAH